jgi:hypothetical protein
VKPSGASRLAFDGNRAVDATCDKIVTWSAAYALDCNLKRDSKAGLIRARLASIHRTPCPSVS